MAGKQEQIMAILQQLKSEDLNVEALSVVSLDGLPIASLLPHDAEENRVAAMSAAILALGERALAELKKGALEQAYVKGEFGYVITTGIKNLAVLMVVTNKEAKLGMLMLTIKKGIEELEKVI